jgi:hypothetical protein
MSLSMRTGRCHKGGCWHLQQTSQLQQYHSTVKSKLERHNDLQETLTRHLACNCPTTLPHHCPLPTLASDPSWPAPGPTPPRPRHQPGGHGARPTAGGTGTGGAWGSGPHLSWGQGAGAGPAGGQLPPACRPGAEAAGQRSKEQGWFRFPKGSAACVTTAVEHSL